VADTESCPPVDALGAFKIHVPADLDLQDVSGAVVQLFTRHDLTSRVQEVPRHRLELLADSGEATWGPGTTYQQVATAAADATVGPVTTFKKVAYDVETFTFSCADLAKLVANAANGQVAFRVTSSGDTLDESLYAYETGFGRRSSGLEYRPRLVLFPGTGGDPLGQQATGAPAIQDVRVERVDATTTVVHWTTDQPSDSVVFVHPQGTTDEVVQVGSPAFVTTHQVQVTGVAKGTPWPFALRSTTPEGRATTADDGGVGWLMTDAAPAPPGPALAAPGTARLGPVPAAERQASPDAVAHGTGRACAASAEPVSPAAASAETAVPVQATAAPTATRTALISSGRAAAGIAGLALLLVVGRAWPVTRRRVST
jgi:hypothetical protein